MQKTHNQLPGNLLQVALNCLLGAVVSGLLTAMTLAGIVLLLSSYTLTAG